MNPKKMYQTRGKTGEEAVYATPAKLLAKAYAYFAWCESNPFTRPDLMKSGSMQGQVIEVPVGRPYTLTGLCVYCGISQSTFDAYERDPIFGDAATHIHDVVKQEQLEGALLGHYNATLVARLQGFADKDDEPLPPLRIVVSVEETKRELDKLVTRLGA